MNEYEYSFIELAYRTFSRAPKFLTEVFEKKCKSLTAEECLKIMNIYGIMPKDVILLAFSHKFSFDERGFERLVKEQIEESKNSRLC